MSCSGLTETEAELVTQLRRGMALWKVGRRSFLVEHRLSSSERWLTDTDQAMADYETDRYETDHYETDHYETDHYETADYETADYETAHETDRPMESAPIEPPRADRTGGESAMPRPA